VANELRCRLIEALAFWRWLYDGADPVYDVMQRASLRTQGNYSGTSHSSGLLRPILQRSANYQPRPPSAIDHFPWVYCDKSSDQCRRNIGDSGGPYGWICWFSEILIWLDDLHMLQWKGEYWCITENRPEAPFDRCDYVVSCLEKGDGNWGGPITNQFIEGSIRLYPPVFPANLEEISLAFSLLSVIRTLMLDHPLYPVYPEFEDSEQRFLIESVKISVVAFKRSSRLLQL
jgi:hypothetical protein